MVNGKEISPLIIKIFIVTLLAQIQLFHTTGALMNESSYTSYFDSSADTDIPKSTTDDYYNDSQEDPNDMFRLGTDLCSDKAECSDGPPELSFPDKSCYCDKRCSILGDCCSNYDFKSSSSLTKDQFSCVEMPEIVKNLQFGVSLVTKCAPNWDDSITKQLCENISNTDDILLKLPVSEMTEEAIMYKNMYCAQCNNVFDYKFWTAQMKCQDENCEMSMSDIIDFDWLDYIRPNESLGHRLCQLRPEIVESCPNITTGDDSSKRCTDNLYSIVYDKTQVYKNKYCALCNGILEENLLCEQNTSERSTICPGLRAGLNVLVISDSGTVSKNGVNAEVPVCKDNDSYVGLSAKEYKKLQLFCSLHGQVYKGKRILHTAAVHSRRSHSYNASEKKHCKQLDPKEYRLINSSHLYVNSQQTVYTEDDFLTIGSDVFICIDAMVQSDSLQNYLTLICLTISISSLVITLIIYLSFPQLLNTPGKLLICLIICLLLGQTLFIISSEVQHISALCKTVAVAVHFCFLAAFCWMNVIALDLWMTFSNRFVTIGTSNRETKRFALYSVYAWLTPVIIVTTSVVLDFVYIGDNFSNLKPQYGEGICWITSNCSLILFFVGPLALFKLFDITAFIFTAVHIARAKREGAMASNKKSPCYFLINLKLSFIMGLTWVIGFVAHASSDIYFKRVMGCIFIIFNGLQGLFIALCVLCTRKVRRLLKNKYQQMFSSGTQVTSLS